MAAPSDFKGSALNGVTVSSGAFQADYINDIEGKVTKPMTEFKEDRFFPGDGKTISQTIEDFTEINEKIEATNAFYKKYPEMKELMNKIIEEMTKIKQKKTSVDPSELKTACDKYNGNLEAAKYAYATNESREQCVSYNRSPYPQKATAVEKNFNPNTGKYTTAYRTVDVYKRDSNGVFRPNFITHFGKTLTNMALSTLTQMGSIFGGLINQRDYYTIDVSRGNYVGKVVKAGDLNIIKKVKEVLDRELKVVNRTPKYDSSKIESKPHK